MPSPGDKGGAKWAATPPGLARAVSDPLEAVWHHPVSWTHTYPETHRCTSYGPAREPSKRVGEYTHTHSLSNAIHDPEDGTSPNAHRKENV